SLASIAKGSASQANISTKDIGNVFIDLPNINVQNKIVYILELISNKIELNNRINDNLTA
uniref:restriction endonuclease subunit S n=1 Tax=Oceanivirga salmonicida TaxID=1769291 RepID=UPI0018D21C55